MLREEFRSVVQEVKALYANYASPEDIGYHKYPQTKVKDHFNRLTEGILSSLDAEVEACLLDPNSKDAKERAQELLGLLRKYCKLFEEFPEFRSGELNRHGAHYDKDGTPQGFFSDIYEKRLQERLSPHKFYVLESEIRLKSINNQLS